MQLVPYTRTTPWMPTLGAVEAYILETNKAKGHQFDITFDWRQDYQYNFLHLPETLIVASFPMPDCHYMRRRLHMTRSGLSIWNSVLNSATLHDEESPWVAYKSVIDMWMDYGNAADKEINLKPLATLADAHF